MQVLYFVDGEKFMFFYSSNNITACSTKNEYFSKWVDERFIGDLPHLFTDGGHKTVQKTIWARRK